LTDALQDAAWGDKPHEAVKEARKRAKEIRRFGNTIDADTVLLSTYIGSLNQVRVHRLRHLLVWGLLAEYHALCLRLKEWQLDIDQLDVLSVWFIRTAPYVPGRYIVAHHFAAHAVLGAEAAFGKGRGILPHQLALAHVTYARAAMLLHRKFPHDFHDDEVRLHIKQALELERRIRHERDQLHGLRQLVRILKGAGQLMLDLGCYEDSYALLKQALSLAEGEADTESQARIIRDLILAEKGFSSIIARGI
jgi:hypothetical protein